MSRRAARAALALAVIAVSTVSVPVRAEEGTGILPVQVLDERGNPVAGANVRLAHEEAPGEELLGTADEAGRYRFPALLPGRYRLTVEKEGLATRVVEPVLVAGGAVEALVVRTTSACALGLRVEDIAGLGVPEAMIRLSRAPSSGLGGEGRWEVLEDGRARTETDGEGKASLPGLPRGRYRVAVRAADLAPLDTELLVETADQRQVWTLRPGGAVAGRVVDGEERPIDGAVVRLVDRLRAVPEDDTSPEVVTGENGEFRLFGLAAGSWRLEASAAGAMPLVRDGLEIEEGRTARLGTILIEPGLSLEGRVVTPDDEPVAAAEVRVHQRARHRRRLTTVTTDEDGHFRADGLTADAVDVIVSPPAEHVAILEESVTPPRGDLELVVEPAGSVAGTVRIRRGTLPPRVRVGASLPDVDLGPYPYPEDFRPETRDVDPESGRFVLEGVPAGDGVQLSATAPGYWSEPVAVDVESGEEAGPVHLLLERGHACEGEVLDLGGAPVGSARVAARHGTSGRVMGRGVTGADGSFVVDGIHPGTHSIVAEHEDYAPAEVTLTFPLDEGETVMLEVGRGGTIDGSVTSATGEPVEGIRIDVSDPPFRTRTDALGRYRIEKVPAGERSVVRRGTDGFSDYEQRKIELPEAQTVTVDFTLGKVLEGRVTRAGLPVGGASLTLATPRDFDADYGGDEFAAQSTYADVDGRFRLGGVRSGPGTLTIGEGLQTTVRLVEVAEGPSPRLDIDLPSRPVQGTVLAARDESPLPGATVEADLPSLLGTRPESGWSTVMSTSSADGQMNTIWLTARDRVSVASDAAGAFTIFVDQSSTEVSAYSGGYQWAEEELPAEGQSITFRLERIGRRVVRLRDAAGRPVPEGWACYMRAEGGGTSCSHFGTGQASFQLREGMHVLEAGGAGHALYREEGIEVTADAAEEAQEQVLTLAPGVPLRIRWVATGVGRPEIEGLVDPRGRSIVHYLDETVADEETGEILWVTRPLEFGTWALTVDPGDGEPITRSVEVAPGQPAEIVLP